MPSAAARAAKTAHVVRTHRTVGTAKRPRGRLPRPARPDGIVREYARALIALMSKIRPAYADLERELPGLLESARRARLHVDDAGSVHVNRADAGESDRIRLLLEQAKNRMKASVSQGDIEALAREFARKTSTFQVKAALGVDVLVTDRALGELTKGFSAENAHLITSIPNQVADDVGKVVLRAVQGGRLAGGEAQNVVQRGGAWYTTSKSGDRTLGGPFASAAEASAHRAKTEGIAPELERVFGFSEDRAKRIARDQVGKFYGEVAAARQKELGITRFIWRTVKDERVRGDPGGLYPKADPSHYDLEGKTFSYDDLPEVMDGQTGLPGQAINCRCYAEPVFDDILEGLD